MTCSACVWCLSGDITPASWSSNRMIEVVPHWQRGWTVMAGSFVLWHQNRLGFCDLIVKVFQLLAVIFSDFPPFLLSDILLNMSGQLFILISCSTYEHFYSNMAAGLWPIEGSKCAVSVTLRLIVRSFLKMLLLNIHLWLMTYPAEVGLGRIPLLCHAFTVIYSEFSPCIRAILHCACRLVQIFFLAFAYQTLKYVFLLAGKPRGNPHKLQTDRPFLPTQGSYSGPSCCRRQCKPQSAAVKM